MATYYDKCGNCPLKDIDADCYSQITGARFAYCEKVSDWQVAEVVHSLSIHQADSAPAPFYQNIDPLQEALKNGYYDSDGVYHLNEVVP